MRLRYARRLSAQAETGLIEALRRGDEQAFARLVDEYGASMLRVARMYVRDRAVAEEVVQEAWLGALRGLDRFQVRSTLKTWIFRILTNTAKTRAEREGRTLPVSALAPAGASVDPDRFLQAGHRWAGHWAHAPQAWDDVPAERLQSRETEQRIAAAIEALPDTQRAVITLRDVEGWEAEEVCNALDLSETNQRVLLHRARAKVRQALEEYLG